RIDELQILGRHNHENVMTAAALAYYGAGIPLDAIRKSVLEFKGVAHRIEFTEEIEGVRYYNDSKGTNPDAAIQAIRAMDRPTLLIGGGYDKGSSYEEWIRCFDNKVKYFALIGQTREAIAEAALRCGFPKEQIGFHENLEEAVHACAERAEAGDAVLLSPACASWGQFDNFEQRGDLFKQYVRDLK
ncbi:MAG: UDP-N-acetylmuramoyl-L-alanine--D-glutamate ligase, partial [Eubacterium sp.]|nr:UDP-N-acetylmuramoyl-L-alanine--D-glutamate ligase [Eubacterium sp.]